jgi:hypothetical protein
MIPLCAKIYRHNIRARPGAVKGLDHDIGSD